MTAGPPTAEQWRGAADVLREHAAKLDTLADQALVQVMFTLKEARLRQHLDTLDQDGEMPYVSAESPARDLDDLMSRFAGFVNSPNGAEILVYPLVYTDDADGVLVVVQKTQQHPRLAGDPTEWDDYFSRDVLDNTLTTDQVVGVMTAVIAEANRIMDSWASRDRNSSTKAVS